MPELPEVETTRMGIEPHVLGQKIVAISIRQHRLRWPIPAELSRLLPGQKISQVSRRGKYLILRCQSLHLILHLGMSGSLRLVTATTAHQKHDHVDIELSNGYLLRFTDPRRFGALLYCLEDPQQHELLRHLGPEPLSQDFSGEYLFLCARKKKTPVKNFIMDARTVVGVGNIYANEALYLAQVDPRRAAGRISAQRYQRLAGHIKGVLASAIEKGGTTLKDFVGGDGKPGYFQQQLCVYGRGGEPCLACDRALKEIRIGQRSTVYCSSCQK